MKYFVKIITVFIVLSMLSACTPKIQIYQTAVETLTRIESTCNEIADDVEKLDDEYTTKAFQHIMKEIVDYRMLLESKPNKSSIESAVVSLARLEKELGSIKVLSSGMDDYTPELNFIFTNNTDKVITEITLDNKNGETINAFSGEMVPGTNITIVYPIEDETWNITSVMDNGDKVSGENISLSTINGIKLNNTDGKYEYTTN